MRFKLLAGFCWRFAILYGLLIAPWPGFSAAYGRYFRALGRATFAHERGSRLLEFEPVPADSFRGLDTRVLLANRTRSDARGNTPVRYLELDTRGVGWIPTALLIALTLATPVSWLRRWLALMLGLAAVHLFILFSVAVYIWNNSTDFGLLALSASWKRVAAGLQETLVTQLGAGLFVPVFLWVLFTIRRADLVDWRRRAGRGSDGSGDAKSR